MDRRAGELVVIHHEIWFKEALMEEEMERLKRDLDPNDPDTFEELFRAQSRKALRPLPVEVTLTVERGEEKVEYVDNPWGVSWWDWHPIHTEYVQLSPGYPGFTLQSLRKVPKTLHWERNTSEEYSKWPDAMWELKVLAKDIERGDSIFGFTYDDVSRYMDRWGRNLRLNFMLEIEE